MKKNLSIVLSVLMVLTLMPALAFAEETAEDTVKILNDQTEITEEKVSARKKSTKKAASLP